MAAAVTGRRPATKDEGAITLAHVAAHPLAGAGGRASSSRSVQSSGPSAGPRTGTGTRSPARTCGLPGRTPWTRRGWPGARTAYAPRVRALVEPDTVGLHGEGGRAQGGLTLNAGRGVVSIVHGAPNPGAGPSLRMYAGRSRSPRAMSSRMDAGYSPVAVVEGGRFDGAHVQRAGALVTTCRGPGMTRVRN
jgi:hypothetical protein